MSRERRSIKSTIDWRGRRDGIDEIARRLDELLRAMGDVSQAGRPGAGLDGDSLEAARQVWRARRERDRIFGATLAADPGWDILLDLFIAMGERREVTIAATSASTGIEEETVLRCIAHLANARLVAGQPQRFDEQTTCLSLTDQALAMMSEYLARTRELGAAAA